MEAQYKAEQIEHENLTLRAAQQRNRVVIGLISLILLLVLASAVILYRANRQKREANRKLAASNDQVAQQRDDQKVLVHILSHDLANVLGNVRNSLDLITDEPHLLSELGPMAVTVTDRGIDVISLVRRMRALEEGATLDLEPVALRAAVDETTLVLRNQLQAKDITVDNDVDASMVVVAERVSLIISVLANVLTNAIKFSPRGQTVDIRAEEVGDGCEIRLSVRDYGIGMPDEIRDRLFDIGQATSRPGTAGEQGNGFGMPLVKRFVEQYGGRITVWSRERAEAPGDPGTEVRIVLTAAEATVADVKPRSRALAEQD
ncbi:MAG: hypothetical protein GVY18_05520 [Bacteroidetes bacterium]|jgi:signal transduction histidine kinase|nr:hypothetical protein [Bacteroidota bacterium]